ncbi:MAG: MFS transporter [Acidobacteriota bacterium]
MKPSVQADGPATSASGPFHFSSQTGLFLAALKMDFNFDVVTLAVPLAAVALGATPLQLGLLGALQRVLYMLVCPVTGHLSDQKGRKALALLGAVGFGVVCLGLAMASTIASLFWLVPGIGLALGLYWPALQGWLSDEVKSGGLGHSTRWFNVCWSLGSLAGMVGAGIFISVSHSLPFHVAALLTLVIVCVLTVTSQSEGQVRRRQQNDRSAAAAIDETPGERAQRYAALVSLFVAYVITGAFNTQFPKIATDLGYSPLLVAITMGFLPFVRTLGFGFLRPLIVQPDIRWTLAGAKLIQVVAVLPFLAAPVQLSFVGFSLLGIVSAVVFGLSQFLALKYPAKAGQRIGLHESFMIGGIMTGAVLSGFLTQSAGYSMTFACGGLLALLSLAARPALFFSAKGPKQQA